MVQVVSDIIESDPNTSLLLVDIGVWNFREVLEKHKDRARNIGIFEAGTVSLASGLSLMGITPTIYGISPFIVQRALEQIKLDFLYQKTGGNFITTGASYDFSTLGYSHYCPEDVATLLQLPGMEILTPGTSTQFVSLYKETYNNGNPTYFRMTDHCVNTDIKVSFGKANVIKKGTQATVLAVAETLDKVIAACDDLDVTILYYTTLAPFDCKTLQENCSSRKLLLCEPFYTGTLYTCVLKALGTDALKLDSVGVPRVVLRNYGTKTEKDDFCGLTVKNIQYKLFQLLK